VSTEVRRLLPVAAVVAAFGLVHEVCARIVAGRDLLGALLNQFDAVTLLLGFVIACTRATLLLIFPGWIAYRLVQLLLATPGSRGAP
jgi:hypothetical protein